jgi:cell wall-associated NlpC family hydrolase
VFWWGGGAPRAPLIGRSFRHGVTDCYALLRDYYALERGIELPEFPRRSQWWDLGGDMLAENFEQVGFRQLHGPDQLAPGDALLGRIGGGVVNHCGIYIGQGLILHHLTNRLSRREPLEPWKRYISHYLRYEP